MSRYEEEDWSAWEHKLLREIDRQAQPRWCTQPDWLTGLWVKLYREQKDDMPEGLYDLNESAQKMCRVCGKRADRAVSGRDICFNCERKEAMTDQEWLEVVLNAVGPQVKIVGVLHVMNADGTVAHRVDLNRAQGEKC